VRKWRDREGSGPEGLLVRVRVICYEGYKARETPRTFYIRDRRIEVVDVLDRWLGEDHEYVKLMGSDGSRYILRYDHGGDSWEITLMEAAGARGFAGVKTFSD
jgi:hypothetical protein